jgi:hypothetical protein
MPRSAKTAKKAIGWREWIACPDLGIDKIKAKVDTGARSSSLHAFHVRVFQKDGRDYVQFSVHPIQRNTKQTIEAEAEVLEFREVRSSNGHISRRPVIQTTVKWMDQCWPIEVTLANRDEMGFRMLLGREAVRSRFLVDPGRSFLGGTLKKAKR